ncbi:hypothetical protein ACFE04_020788 [Oxalis oulophora]
MELDYLEDSDQRNSRKTKRFPQASLQKLRHCNSSNSQNRRLQNEMHVQNDDKTLLEGLGCEWKLYIDFQSKMKDDLDTLPILVCEFQEALRAIKCFLNVMKLLDDDKGERFESSNGHIDKFPLFKLY